VEAPASPWIFKKRSKFKAEGIISSINTGKYNYFSVLNPLGQPGSLKANFLPENPGKSPHSALACIINHYRMFKNLRTPGNSTG
jgi:hypothetical protein